MLKPIISVLILILLFSGTPVRTERKTNLRPEARAGNWSPGILVDVTLYIS